MSDNRTIVAIGEVLWDCFPEGKQLGGAPFNFVYHAGKLGANSFLVTAIGNDKYGIEAKNKADKLDINTSLFQINEYPTGTVIVNTDVNGIPDYNISLPAAWDHIELREGDKNLIQQADVLCFGSLAQRNEVSRNTIQCLIDNASPSTLVVFDINLRQDFYNDEIIIRSLERTNILKLNEDELPIVSRIMGMDNKDEKETIEEISARYGISLIAYTKGKSGSYLYDTKEFSFLTTPKVNVLDTVGAGDAFTASIVKGYMESLNLRQIHQQAVELAAFVCTKQGATPSYMYQLN
jgi:fructokinase